MPYVDAVEWVFLSVNKLKIFYFCMKKRCSEMKCINDNGYICTAPHTVRIPRKRHYFWSEPCGANIPEGEQTNLRQKH